MHFGGGTPSLMGAEDVGRILEAAEALWGLPKNIEIGLEANPNDIETDILTDLKSAGINRMSLGVQTFHDDALKLLGRDHSGTEAARATELAVRTFSNVSLDLIFGWRGQNQSDLQSDLDQALGLAVQHISTYQLTIEPGTAFAKAEARGDARRVDDDDSAEFMAMVNGRLKGAGFDHYEVSNFGRPGFYSQHNLAYWRGLDYVGVGPGAHGRLTLAGTRHATTTHMKPGAYIERIAKDGNGLSENSTLDSQSWADEYVMMGLRCFEGISAARFQEIAGQVLPSSELENLIEEGLLIQSGDRLLASDKGRPFLDYITRKLLV